VQYIARDLPFEELVALYRAADVMLVTPLRDGMNLVAKEFVATRLDEDGVLVLSEFAGAASELAEAVTVNPFDIEGSAEAYYRALTMPQPERTSRMRALRRRVVRTPVQAWASGFLAALDAPLDRRRPPVTRTPAAVMDEVITVLHGAAPLIVLTDYDGTLVPFARTPELARPDAEVLGLLQRLAARPETEVHVVSGRDRATLRDWLGHLPIGLHGEHGFWSRAPGEQGQGSEAETVGTLDWKEPLRSILEDYTLRTPGSLLEEKAMGFAWHYRATEPDFGQQQAGELHLYIAEMFSNAPVEVLHGAKVVEVRPQGIHKGRVASALADRYPEATLLALGDDRTDEDLFAALPAGRSFAVHVGPTPSQAAYRVDSVRDVRAILQLIAA
jgi:trehalose 6-phosphate synthase/phosphatase